MWRVMCAIYTQYLEAIRPVGAAPHSPTEVNFLLSAAVASITQTCAADTSKNHGSHDYIIKNKNGRGERQRKLRNN